MRWLRRRRKLPPGWTSYRSKVYKPTPEDEETLRRWAEEADRRARQRLKELYGE
jgi:hypothetical protein